MGKANESIFDDHGVIIPMADVQHIEKMYRNCDLLNGSKKGDLMGSSVITKHTTWDISTDSWANSIWLNADQTKRFLKDWCFYRHQIESESLLTPAEMLEGTNEALAKISITKP